MSVSYNDKPENIESSTGFNETEFLHTGDNDIELRDAVGIAHGASGEFYSLIVEAANYMTPLIRNSALCELIVQKAISPEQGSSLAASPEAQALGLGFLARFNDVEAAQRFSRRQLRFVIEQGDGYDSGSEMPALPQYRHVFVKRAEDAEKSGRVFNTPPEQVELQLRRPDKLLELSEALGVDTAFEWEKPGYDFEEDEHRVYFMTAKYGLQLIADHLYAVHYKTLGRLTIQ